MEETISLKELFQTLKKRLNLILIITITAVAIIGIISYFFLTPIYQTSTQILVNQTKGNETTYSTSDVQTNLQLINTYNVIIKSPAILDLVIKELDLDMTASQLNQKITVESAQNSQVVNLTVQDSDAYLAADIANKTAQVFEKEIKKIMSIDNVSILAEAMIGAEQSPVKPQPLLNIAIALVVGLMAGVGVAFLIEYLDNTLKSEQDVEKLLQLPVLGIITVIEETGNESLRTRSDRKGRLRGETIGS